MSEHYHHTSSTNVNEWADRRSTNIERKGWHTYAHKAAASADDARASLGCNVMSNANSATCRTDARPIDRRKRHSFIHSFIHARIQAVVFTHHASCSFGCCSSPGNTGHTHTRTNLQTNRPTAPTHGPARSKLPRSARKV